MNERTPTRPILERATGEPPGARPLIDRGEVDPASDPGLHGGSPVSHEEPYWEISGPRKYLHIPTPVPDRWCAKLTFGSFPKYQTVTAWGPTEQDARDRATDMALAHGVHQ